MKNIGFTESQKPVYRCLGCGSEYINRNSLESCIDSHEREIEHNTLCLNSIEPIKYELLINDFYNEDERETKYLIYIIGKCKHNKQISEYNLGNLLKDEHFLRSLLSLIDEYNKNIKTKQ